MRRACLTGVVIIPNGPLPAVTAEFWDQRENVKLTEIDIPEGSRTYQTYFPDDYFVQDPEDVICVFTDELPRQVEVLMRWGDRNPMKVY